MLQHFTWQQFLIAALILNLVWYIAIILIYYRKELNAFLNGRSKVKSSDEPLPHVWENEYQEDEPDDLLGKPAAPEGVSSVSMNDFGFASQEDSSTEDQLCLVPDVLEELKSIFNILEREDGNKADFFSLLKLVKSKYPKIGSSPAIQFINEFIRDHVSFLLTKEEFEDLWD